jgi:RNA polymerase sigma-70 factor (ECF subfamily)
MTETNELFISLMREYRKSLFRLANSILRNDADAEDAVSEATVKAFQNFGRLRKPESFKPWMFKILVNEAYAIARKRRNHESLDNLRDDGAGEPPVDALAIWSAVLELPDEYRSVTVLFYYEDMSIREIGRILNIPVGTVNSRLNRSREKLRAIFKE